MPTILDKEKHIKSHQSQSKSIPIHYRVQKRVENRIKYQSKEHIYQQGNSKIDVSTHIPKIQVKKRTLLGTLISKRQSIVIHYREF